MALSLGRAAKAVGRSKSALSRDVKAGRISAVRNADGSLSIDPSELFRVFRPVGANNGGWEESQPQGNAAGIAATPRERAPDSLPLYLRLAKAEAERDLLLDQISDLRARLDAEAEERRRLTAVLLTERRASEPEPPAREPPPAAWPRRLWRWFARQHRVPA